MTERVGLVSRLNPESGEIIPLADLRNIVATDMETGLLGLVHHPDFSTEPFVYLVYTFESGDTLLERLSRFEYIDGNLQNELFLLDSLPSAIRHCGSRIVVSQDDKIFMTIGDARVPLLSQDSTGFVGKVLRINLDGSIPDDNPYPDSYVYSYGHRNSQGLVFGPNGFLYASEHGEFRSDELNIIEPKRNYGWPYVEGICDSLYEQVFCDSLNIKEPIHHWDTCQAVNDLVFYENMQIPEWEGKLLMATLGGVFGVPGVFVLTLDEDGLSVIDEKRYFSDYGRIRDVCVNPNTGAIYFATNGFVYPGEGPNSIIEYKRKIISSTEKIGRNPNELIQVFPNVINRGDEVRLQFNFDYKPYYFDIYSNDGKVMDSQKITSPEERISTLGWSSGMYFVRLRSNSGHSIYKKIIVQ